MGNLIMHTRDAVLRIAEWQVGVVESPAGSNKTKYGQRFGLDGYPWCMMFVWWVFHEAGFNLKHTASCTALTNSYKQAGQWVTKDFKPGDIVMFDFSGKKSKTEHTGIVYEVQPGKLITIEGNTGKGADANGGKVMMRARPLKFITGACRPGYNV